MATSASPGEGETPSGSSEGRYECNICFEQATEAVVSMCGHLFCWPCIHRWMESRPNNPTCPVCKSKIERERLIPLYGRGANDKVDPRDKVPPRPQGQREEPAHHNETGMDGIQFSFGIGAFPFAMMGGPMFQVFGNRPRGQQAELSPQEQEQQRRMAALFATFAVLIFVLMLFS